MPGTVIAVVGPGAVGGLLAALLERNGSEVVVVARPDAARAINAEGLSIRSRLFGDWTARPRALDEIPTGALVIVATKAFALPDVATGIRAARPAEVVSVLNGLEHMGTLRAAAPAARVAGATIAVEAARTSPIVIDLRSPFLRLAVAVADDDLGIVAALRHAGLQVAADEGTEADVLWRKFRFLAPMALLTSYWEQPIGDALQHDRGLTSRLLDEVAGIATADSVPTGGEQIHEILSGFPFGMRSSLQADLEAHGPSELDAIGGALLRRGRSLGVDTPELTRVVAALSER
jgi:2-dehydropantoate 2-reductase